MSRSGAGDEVATPVEGHRRPRWRPWTRVLAVLAVLGPGLIAANAGNDAGGVMTYASAGAQFGYSTLFLMVLITVALIVVQEMCSRLGAYTGEGLGGLIREEFSPRSSSFAMLLLLIANAGLVRVYYGEFYRDERSLAVAKQAGIELVDLGGAVRS